jgi:hypothetical protein
LTYRSYVGREKEREEDRKRYLRGMEEDGKDIIRYRRNEEGIG